MKKLLHDRLTGSLDNELIQPLHPLLDSNISTFKQTSFAKLFTGKEFYLMDHRVKDVPLLPSVVYLEMARVAGTYAMPEQHVIGLRNIVWTKPIRIFDRAQKVILNLYPKSTSVAFEVITQQEPEDPFEDNELQSKINIHAQGTLLFSEQYPQAEPQSINIVALKQSCKNIKSGKQIYAECASVGIEYGRSFQVIENMASNGSELIAYLRLPEHLHKDANNFMFHPSLMDGALETIFGILQHDTTSVYLPFGIDELNVFEPLTKFCYVYATVVANTQKTKMPKFNILLTDDNGKVLVSIKNFALRLMQAGDIAEKVDTYYYHPEWKPENRDVQSISFNGPVLVIDDGSNIVSGLQEKYPHQNIFHIHNQPAEDYEKKLNEIGQIPSIIIYKTHLDFQDEMSEITIRESLQVTIYNLFYLTRAILLQQQSNEPIRILCLNQSRGNESLFVESLSGFAKTVTIENPNIVCRVINIHNSEVDELQILLNELNTVEKDIRYEKNQRWIKQYVENPPQKNLSSMLRKNGVYLITGGAGGLGLIFARYLAKYYQARLVMIGRSKLNLNQQITITDLENLGATVLYIRSDITKRDDVIQLIQTIKSQHGGINGIIHSAGVVYNATISKKTPAEIDEVISPKIFGTLYLDEFTKDEPLDFFAIFSSMVSVFGNAGQSDYAYANCFIDAFAAQRENQREKNQRHGKTVSINWPLLTDVGMQTNKATKIWVRKTFGIVPLTKEDSIYAFLSILSQPFTQQIVLPGNKMAIERNFQSASVTPKVNSLWFKVLNENEANKLQLFCFPYAGGGTNVFAGWNKYFSKQVRLHLLELPGREARFNEKPIAQFYTLIQKIADAVSEQITLPFVFFGYSFGAIIAYEVAKELYRRYKLLPNHLLIASMCSPQLFTEQSKALLESKQDIVDLLQTEYEQALQTKGKNIIRDDKILQLWLPALRNDLQLTNDYLYSEKLLLNCPITVFSAEKDALYSLSSMDAWSSQTSNAFINITTPGNHFSMIIDNESLIAHINKIISDYYETKLTRVL